MNLKQFKSDDDFNGLNFRSIDVDLNKIEAPTKNGYFVGVFPAALGIASILYGILHYGRSNGGFSLTTEFWIFLVLGILAFGGGIIMVLKAVVYVLTLKSFLQNAKFTKCNVKCVIEKVKRSGENNRSYEKTLYNLIVNYINDDGEYCTKIFKYLLANKYCQIYENAFGIRLLASGSQPLILEDFFIVAYNKKGKVVLVY